jgi:hypothetical protein
MTRLGLFLLLSLATQILAISHTFSRTGISKVFSHFSSPIKSKSNVVYEAESGRKRATLPDLYEASIGELQVGLDAGDFTSVDLVKVLHLAPLSEMKLTMKL